MDIGHAFHNQSQQHTQLLTPYHSWESCLPCVIGCPLVISMSEVKYKPLDYKLKPYPHVEKAEVSRANQRVV